MRLRSRTAVRCAMIGFTIVIASGLIACGRGGAQSETATMAAATDTTVPQATDTSPPADTATPEDTPTLAATEVEPTVEELAPTAEATGEAVTFQFPTMGSADAPVTIIEFSDYL
jgi:protein-disulfide isomerase